MEFCTPTQFTASNRAHPLLHAATPFLQIPTAQEPLSEVHAGLASDQTWTLARPA